MKRKMQNLLIGVLVVVFAAAGIGLGMRLYQNYVARQDYQQATEIGGLTEPTPEVTATPEVMVTPIPTVEPTVEPTIAPTTEITVAPTPAPTPEPTSAPAPKPTANPQNGSTGTQLGNVDLAALRKVNPDVVGWISIPGTQLSYPLMQGSDNQYYLNHSWKKARNGAGSIYLDYRNSSDMSDFNSIIYGHRMSDGSMFNSLRHYRDQNYYEQHPSVYLVTDEGVLRYDIFTAYEADVVNGHTYRLGLVEAAGQQAYINYCSRRSVLQTNVVPEPGDHIITLSTCVSMGAEYDTRWVVQAVRKTTP